METTTLLSTFTLKLLAKHNSLDYKKSEGIDTIEEEIEDIANFLCGENNQIAIDFMNGYMIATKGFINNVKYNTNNSVPYIIRAIQLHLQSNT